MSFVPRVPKGDGYSSSDVVTMAGCTFRQLDHWVNSKYLTPAVESTGSGSVRVFEAITLSIVRIALDLITAGFTPKAALGYANRLALDPRVAIVVAGGAVTLWNTLSGASESNESAAVSG